MTRTELGSGAAASRRTSARELLLAAALRKFGERGVLEPTLEEIRRAAGVSVGALYHHFPDRSHLVGALYVELTADFQDGFVAELRAHPGAREGVEAGVRHYLRWVSANRRAAAVLLAQRPARDPALRDRNRDFLAEVGSWWQAHVHYGALLDLPAELIHGIWLGPAQEYTRHWLAGRGRRVPASISGVLAEAAWRSLKEDR